jgi:hypothetical protein
LWFSIVCQAHGLHASSLLLVRRRFEWFGRERSNGGAISLIGPKEVGHVVQSVVLPRSMKAGAMLASC